MDTMLESAAMIAFAATADVVASKKFYGDLLKLPLVADKPFTLVFDSNNTML